MAINVSKILLSTSALTLLETSKSLGQRIPHPLCAALFHEHLFQDIIVLLRARSVEWKYLEVAQVIRFFKIPH